MLHDTAASTKKRYLTKSLFLQACECPRKLKYALHPEKYGKRSPEGSFSAQHLKRNGMEVGLYSRLLFPHGKLIGGDQTSLEDMAKETTSLLMQESSSQDGKEVVLFEGVVKSGPLLIRADILRKVPIRRNDNTTGYELHVLEVKAKSWDSSASVPIGEHQQDVDEIILGKNKKSIRSTYVPYIRDVAFQKYVLEQAFGAASQPNCFDQIKAWLVLPDKARINTQIPNLKARLFQTSVSSCGEGSLSLEMDRVTSQLIVDKGEMLVHQVDVDGIVDRVLRNEEEFTFPRAIENPKEESSTFESAVYRWARFVQESTNEAEGEIGQVPHIPPPIGTQCRSCVYRFDPCSTKDGTNINGNGNKDTLISGFHECWDEVIGPAVGCLDKNMDAPIGNSSNQRPVVDLWTATTKQVKGFIEKQQCFIENLDAIDLGVNDANGHDFVAKKEKQGMTRSQRQWYQVQETNKDKNCSSRHTLVGGGQAVIDKDDMQASMERWEYPWHFVDFETIAPALPYSPGRRPYDLLAFQFSHHVVRQPNSSAEHVNEFLCVSQQDPNQFFLEALARALEDEKGTIFRWGAHENTVLSSLLGDSPGLPATSRTFLESLLSGGSRAMVDLYSLAVKSFYVDGSGGSSSLKQILLPTIRASAKLQRLYSQPTYTSRNYKNMQWVQRIPSDGDDREEDLPMIANPYDLVNNDHSSIHTKVTDGGDAMLAYERLQQLSLNSMRDCVDHKRTALLQSELTASLLRYCELDTLAMVMMVQGWEGFLHNDECPEL